jgi:hypothetical protein
MTFNHLSKFRICNVGEKLCLLILMMKGTESSLHIQCCRNIQYSKNTEYSKSYVKIHMLHPIPLKFCHIVNFVLFFFVEKQMRKRKVSAWRDIITFNITCSNFCRTLCWVLCNGITSLRLDTSVPISLFLSIWPIYLTSLSLSSVRKLT